MRRCLGAACSVLAGCGLYYKDPSPQPDAGSGSTYTEVALVPVTINRDLDVLFLIDDTMLDEQNNFKFAFPTLVNELASLPDGLPNVHLGVAPPALGTWGADGQPPGPSIGSGQGACSGFGKNGALQIFGAPVTGAFLSDIRNTDGTRTTNYTGTLVDAFS